jgi:hypothetical protein
VGVPARVVGTPLWSNNSGNHTWVEIWDGDWHFTGAAEQDPKGLDRGWFVGNAAQAVKGEPEHAIYAGSFRRTGLSFPLVWAREVDYVSALNVTERYTARAKPSDPGAIRLLVDVLDRPKGVRVSSKVTVIEPTNLVVVLEGTSKDDSADMNDHLSFPLARQHTYLIETQREGQTRRQYFTPSTNAEQGLVICLSEPSPVATAPPVCYVPPQASTSAASTEWKFPCPENEIAHYTAFHVGQPMHIDGQLEEEAWQQVTWSPRFIDVLSGQPVLYDTRAAILWDEENLYVAFRVEEPFVQASLTANNSPIYQDNDVEVFIAGRDAYYEFEINALNTTYEVFFIWADAYKTGGFADVPEFSRARLKPFNGVGFKTHPRGGRLGDFDWHFPGKQTAVSIQGTLNDSSDRDRGWSVELAFPWKGMTWLVRADGRSLPPREGDVWRMDFSRFNQYKAAPPAKDSGGWFWSPHRVWDSHIPECFPYIRFTTNNVGQAPESNTR